MILDIVAIVIYTNFNILLYYGRFSFCRMCHWYHYLIVFGEAIILLNLQYPSYFCLFTLFSMASSAGIYCYFQTKIIINYFIDGMKTRKWTYSQLVDIHQMHGQLCRYFLIIHDEYWSDILLVLFLIFIPFNVFCVLQIRYFNQMSIDGKAMILLGLSISTSTLIIIPTALAFESKRIYEPKRYLVPIVQRLREPYALRMKLKYDDWFNRLLWGRKYGPTIFSIGPVTYHTVFNVCNSFQCFI